MTDLLLKDLIAFSRDGEWGNSEPSPGTTCMRVIRGTDFDAVRLGDLSDVPERWIDSAHADRKRLKPDDILIESAGGSRDQITGRTLLIKESTIAEGPTTCASFSRIIRVDHTKVLPQYLYWFLQNDHRYGDMHLYHVQHTGVSRFQFTEYARRTRVPIPDRDVQARISELLCALEDKIQCNHRSNRALETLAQRLFVSWFVDFDPVVSKREGRSPMGVPPEAAALFPSHLEDSELGPIPQGWRVDKLASVSKTQYGFTASASSEPVGPHFLRITDMNKEPWIDWSRVPFCKADDDVKQRYGLRVGDIVVSRMADPGKAGIVEEPVDAVFASYLIRLEAAPCLRYWLYYFLRSDEYRDYAEGAQGGTVQANMNAQVIVAARAVVPPEEVALAFESVIRPLRQQIVAHVTESRTLANLRDTLLGPLLSGEVTIKAAEKAVGAAV